MSECLEQGEGLLTDGNSILFMFASLVRVAHFVLRFAFSNSPVFCSLVSVQCFVERRPKNKIRGRPCSTPNRKCVLMEPLVPETNYAGEAHY